MKWTCAVQARSPRPFRFAGIKGAYRNAAMASTFKAFDDCEIDSSLCADDEDQPSNANALREGNSAVVFLQAGRERESRRGSHYVC